MAAVRDRAEVVVYADHNQFLVGDAGWAGLEDDAEEEHGSRAALEERLGASRSTLTVYTATYGYVRVVLERVDTPAAPDVFDHVVEAPLVVTSGRVAILEATEPRAELPIAPASYAARVFWRGVAEGEQADPPADAPAETILIQLYPGAAAGRTVLRWYPAWKPSDERPPNPYGLRVLVGRECDRVEGARVVGEPRDVADHDDRSLVRAADGTHWLHFYSQRPPYNEVMLELPQAALADFTLRPQPPPAEAGEDEAVRAASLPPEERYRYFVDTVARTGWLWTLADELSPIVWQDEEGRDYWPVWPHPRAAEPYAAEEVPDARPDDHELDEWLQTIERRDFVVVFPMSLHDTGVIVPASVLAGEVRAARGR